MCASSVLSQETNYYEKIVEKYNSELQQKRVEFSMMEIIEKLDNLFNKN